MSTTDLDSWQMARALTLAERGRGFVEPNPLVGCIIARGAETIGEGWHRRFGGPHAEIEALALAGPGACRATMYVTLEPCCHHGKTPPCTDAILAAGIQRIVAAVRDPFPSVDGGGFAQLSAAGVEVESDVLADEAAALNAPYLKLLRTGMPWVIAKWAMTLDGKLATTTGDSRWISCEESRAIVHALRGRVDAVVVGRGTAERDDPLLTARPEGPRRAARVVLDTMADLSTRSQLARSAHDWPVLVATSERAPSERSTALTRLGCEMVACGGNDHAARLRFLLAEMGRRRWTNVLFEGGSKVLGTLFDAGLVDEVHVFIAPKVAGGAEAPSPLAGAGIEAMADALSLAKAQWRRVGSDIHLTGRVERLAGKYNISSQGQG